MKLIIRGKGTQKTTQLVYTSATTGYRIITANAAQADAVMNMAQELGVTIPIPMPWNQYKYQKGLHDKGLLLDEVKYILDDLLDAYFGCHVYAATMRDEKKGDKHD